MGMSIEEIIEIEHKYLDDNESTFEMESLFDSFISVMEKYQKIKEIVIDYDLGGMLSEKEALIKIVKIVRDSVKEIKDGNVD